MFIPNDYNQIERVLTILTKVANEIAVPFTVAFANGGIQIEDNVSEVQAFNNISIEDLALLSDDGLNAMIAEIKTDMALAEQYNMSYDDVQEAKDCWGHYVSDYSYYVSFAQWLQGEQA
jgi:hypothetical protein